MKKCPYCGNEYPDEVAVCPLDGESLALSAERKKVTGVWRGVYGYGPRENRPGIVPTAFTLKLKQGWTSHFTGSVTEDDPPGTPGTGTLEGYFSHPTIEFTKQMPVGYIMKEDGTRTTLREHLAARGQVCKQELPGSAILYRGGFLDANRVQGIWISQPRRIALPGGKSLGLFAGAGYWCAEFVTEDLNANPTGGPVGELFDKSRLTAREVADVESALCSLGKFTVMDAERLIERLANADILCRFSQDDSAVRGMMPATAVTGGCSGMAPLMEIFVSPDDAVAAQGIIGEDGPL
jgi:hypothetical protein